MQFSETDKRSKIIVRTSVIGIMANVFLAAFKAVIGMAKKLLLTTDLRISEVASSCGYQNATHFMRQFRTKTGMSPSEFRDR